MQTKIETGHDGIKHGLMLLWFADLMNVTKEVTIHRPNISTLLTSLVTFIESANQSSIKPCLEDCKFTDKPKQQKLTWCFD